MSKTELIEEAKALGIVLTGEEHPLTLRKLIKAAKAPSEPSEPSDDDPSTSGDDDSETAVPKKGVAVEFYHRGFGRMEKRVFLRREDAESFMNNPENAWADAASGARTIPYEVER